MTIYCIINTTNNTFEAFNYVSGAAKFVGLDDRTFKKHLNSGELIKNKFIIASNELQKFTRKRKKGWNVSLNGLEQHNNDF